MLPTVSGRLCMDALNLRSTLAGGIFLLLVLANVAALRWGMADINLYEARYRFATNAQDSDEGSTQGWPGVNARLAHAVDLEPDSARVHREVAQTLLVEANGPGVDPQARVGLLSSASQHYAAAVRQNPLAATSLAGYALTRQQLGSFDGRALAAINHALELGPWLPEIQLVNAHIALALRTTLSAAAIQAQVENVNKAFSGQSRGMADAITQSHAEQWFCSRPIDFTPNALAFCKQKAPRK